MYCSLLAKLVFDFTLLSTVKSRINPGKRPFFGVGGGGVLLEETWAYVTRQLTKLTLL